MGVFRKKNNGLLFSRSDNRGPHKGGGREGGARGKCLQMPSFLEPAGILRVFVIKYLTLN